MSDTTFNRLGRAARVATLAGLLAVGSVATAHAAGGENLITKTSKYSASETLDRLTKALESKGIMIFARVDHAAGAKSVGMDLPATELLIFGNPKLGTPLMQSNRAIGIDLPMKALAWTDDKGQTHLSYTDPETLKSRWAISDKDDVFAKMTGALQKMTDGASGN